MGDRSSSGGVRNLRAMFEDREDTSSPSRGRSPVGSEQSTGSRPISKVRTSFVAVERSGLLGPQLGLRKLSDTGATTMSTGGVADDHTVDNSRTDTQNDMSSSELKVSNSEGHEHVEHEDKEPTTEESKPVVNGVEPSPPIVPETETETETENAVTVPEETSDNLGKVLKGSPFKVEETSGVTTPGPELSTSAEPTDGAFEKPSKQDETPKMNGGLHKNTKAKADSKVTPNKPSAISTKKDDHKGQNASTAPPLSKSTKGSKPSTPKTPSVPSQDLKSKHSSPRQAPSKTSSPKQVIPDKSAVGVSTRGPSATTKASRASTASAPPSKRAGSSSVKEPAAAAFTSKKPTPKSPPRPVRLPTSATAPTAASSAKLGGGTLAPSKSSGHAAATNTTIERKPSTLKKPAAASRGPPPTGIASRYPKSGCRPSLPAASQPADRPKSRASTVASKPPDEGFLARMMRPTTSSASKAHDKLEPKSPPRKVPSAKPKRKSAAEEGTSQLAEGDSKAEKNEAEKTNGVSNDVTDGADLVA